jgi:cation transport ATPase
MSNQPYSPDPRMQGYQQPPNQDGQVPYEGQTVANDTVRSSNMGGAYAQSQHESYVDPMGNRVESHEEVFEDKNQARANIRYWITSITYFVLSVLEVILLLRFIFRLLGANQDNGFIMFLYNLSHVFVIAFNGIFNDQTLGRNGVFEFSTLVAMAVYALLAWGIVSLGRVIFARVLSGRQSVTTTRRSRH